MAALMAAIALAESGGNSDATNPTDNNNTQTSWGLWQISTGTHAEPSPNWANGLTNAQLAVAKYKSQGLSAWGTYDSGEYQKYMQGGVPPSAQLTGMNNPPGNSSGSSSGSNQGLSIGSIIGDVEAFDPFLNSMLKPISWVTGFATEANSTAKAIGGIANDISQLMNWVAFMFMPSSWLRIASFFAGMILLLLGAVMLGKSIGVGPSAPTIVPMPV
jgi:hypothetical protein